MLSTGYSTLCNQTVTVYNVFANGGVKEYRRTVINGAFMDFKRQWQESKTGSTAGSNCLLVIPQGADGKTFVMPVAYSGAENTYTLKKDDKVLLGAGPEITNATEWSKFIPSLVDFLVSVKSVDPKFFNGEIVHVEAG